MTSSAKAITAELLTRNHPVDRSAATLTEPRHQKHGKYPHLFSSFQLGHVKLKNRIVHAATATRGADKGLVSARLITYHANRAKGGAAMTVTEPMNMAKFQKAAHKVNVLDPANTDLLRRWADEVRTHGCHLIAQIQDPGRGRHVAGRSGFAIGASPLPDDLSWTVPHALSASEIETLIAEFARSTAILKDAGFSGAEVSAGHGHLFHQFLSPRSNHRSDQYGGLVDGRAKILKDLISAVREACGQDFVIGLKLPGEDGLKNGIDLAEAKAITKNVAESGGFDYLTYCWGAHALTLDWHLPDVHGPRMPYAEKIKALADAAPGIPIGALGLITDPNEGERLIQSGLADLVILGRSLITDPAWPVKAESGRERDIRYCVSCNTCWHVITTGNALKCDNNPRVGAADEVDWLPEKATQKRHVTIVGAGIAGMEVAWVAAARGHDVTVFGASLEVGGKTRLHAALPGGEGLSSIYDYQSLKAEDYNVRLKLGFPASLSDVMATKPDVVILATGATPAWPEFLPLEFQDENIFPDLRQLMPNLLRRSERQCGTAVLYDCDHTAMTYASAELIADLYDRLVIVTPRDRLAEEEALVNRQGIYRRLFRKNVNIKCNSDISPSSAFEDGEITLTNIYNDGIEAIDNISLLTYATPRTPNDALVGPLASLGVELHVIGDCFAPGSALNATATGQKVGGEI